MIQLFNNLRLAVKRPLVIVLMSLLAMTAMGTFVFRDVRDAMVRDGMDRILLATEARKTEISQMLDANRSDTAFQATSPNVVNALRSLEGGWGTLDDDPTAYLQDVYITQNPNAPSDRGALEYPSDRSSYSRNHRKYHGCFRAIARKESCVDVYLLGRGGHVLYSVMEGNDFAVAAPPDLLADAHAQAKAAPEGAAVMLPFQSHGTGSGMYAAFVRVIRDGGGAPMGTVIYRVGTHDIQRILARSAVLGAEATTFLRGANGASIAHSGRDRRAPWAALFIIDPKGIIKTVNSAAARLFASMAEGAADCPVTLPAPGISVGATGLVSDDGHERLTAQPSIGIEHQIMQMARQLVLKFDPIRGGDRTQLDWVVECMDVTEAQKRRARLDAIEKYHLKAEFDTSGQLQNWNAAFEDVCGTYDDPAQWRHRLSENTAIDWDLIGCGTRWSGHLRPKEQDGQTCVIDASLSPVFDLSGTVTSIALLGTDVTGAKTQLRQIEDNRAPGQLDSAIAEAIASAQSMRNGSDEIVAASDLMGKQADAQATALQSTSRALNSLTANMQVCSDGASAASLIVAETRGKADDNARIPEQAEAAMTAISGSADEIAHIISVIDDIAFQTNLLALNAGVEAARAGEAGRGFAVVASEVRALAQRSADAAAQINTLIVQSGEQVREGVEMFRQTSAALTSIASSVREISGQVDSIANSGREQSQDMTRINSTLAETDANRQGNVAMFNQTARASRSLLARSEALMQSLDGFAVSTVAEDELLLPDTISRVS